MDVMQCSRVFGVGRVPVVQLHGDGPVPRLDDVQLHAEEGHDEAGPQADQSAQEDSQEGEVPSAAHVADVGRTVLEGM